ncbi:MAG: hypothetical protein ACYTBJ_24150, partial [Planctomycetota bacterium]
MSMKLLSVSVSAILWFCSGLPAADEGLVAWWKFDEVAGNSAFDAVSRIEDPISGNFKYVQGVAGKAVRFDGFTTSVTRKADKAPKLGEAFTIEAWAALGAYPWNWCPIAGQTDIGKSGYYFGIDSNG